MPPGGDCNATPALRIQNYLQRRKRMTFEIHSDITNRSMTVAARAMRRVLRRKRSIMWAIFGWSVFLFNALLLISFDREPFALDARTLISLLAEVILLSVLLFQDRFNGMIARKNALAGTKEYHVAFGEDSYSVVTAATTSTFRYELIDAMAESQDYIIFLMKKRYAQPLDKRTLIGGTVEEFKRFLEEKTGKDFRRVK
jgi:hypothetical protein